MQELPVTVSSQHSTADEKQPRPVTAQSDSMHFPDQPEHDGGNSATMFGILQSDASDNAHEEQAADAEEHLMASTRPSAANVKQPTPVIAQTEASRVQSQSDHYVYNPATMFGILQSDASVNAHEERDAETGEQPMSRSRQFVCRITEEATSSR